MQTTARKNTTADDAEIERFSRIAAQWWDENGAFKPLHRMNPVRLSFIREHVCRHFSREGMVPFTGLRVLDVGCGGGLISEPMARMGASVTGIDAAQKNIKVAQLHAERMGLEIDYRCATPEEMTEQFDVILALEIVEHVADVGLFMQSLSARIKPGGLLFMSTLNRSFKAYAMAIIGAEVVMRWLPRGTHEWQKFLKPSELAASLRQNQWRLYEQRGMIWNPISGGWSLSEKDLNVNYIVVAEKQ